MSKFVGEAIQVVPPFFGEWENNPTSFAFQWERSLPGTTTLDGDVAGATESLYVAAVAETGRRVRCKVTATNAGGSEVAYTAWSDLIDELVTEPEMFDPTSPELAVYSTTPALATFATAPSLSVFATAPIFGRVSAGSAYGDGDYGEGSYGGAGTKTIVDATFDIDPDLATLLSSPSLAVFDTPEPALT